MGLPQPLDDARDHLRRRVHCGTSGGGCVAVTSAWGWAWDHLRRRVRCGNLRRRVRGITSGGCIAVPRPAGAAGLPPAGAHRVTSAGGCARSPPAAGALRYLRRRVCGITSAGACIAVPPSVGARDHLRRRVRLRYLRRRVRMGSPPAAGARGGYLRGCAASPPPVGAHGVTSAGGCEMDCVTVAASGQAWRLAPARILWGRRRPKPMAPESKFRLHRRSRRRTA